MVAFNQEVPDTGVTDNTSRSRGGGANRSLGELFSGIGDVLSAGVGTADNYIKNRIEDQARYGLDQLNEGTNSALEDSAQATQSALGGNGAAKPTQTSDTPTAITQTGQSLQNLAMARDQGKITNEFYYQQLNSQLKTLRARYPGYEKDVDQIVQSVTGVRPANAYREALLSKIQSDQQALKSSQDKFDTWKNQNAGYIQMAFPDYFSNPDKYAGQENTIQAGVARLKGQEQIWDYEVKSNQNNQTVLQQKLGDRLSQIGQNLLSGTTRAAGLDLPSFVQNLTTLGSGAGLTSEQQAQMTGQFDQFVFNSRSLLMQEANRPELGMISPTQKQQYVDAAMQPILAIREMITNKQYDQAARVAARNEAFQNQGLADLYQKQPIAALLAGASKISPDVGQYIAQQVIQNMGGVQNFIKGTAVSDQVGNVISGDDTLSDVNGRAIGSQNLSQAEKNQIVSATVNSSLNVIRDGKATPEQITKFVQNNYNNEKDIFKQVTGDEAASGQSQYLKLYTKVFDPKVTEQVVKTGDQKLINQYFDYSVNKFRSIPEIRAAQNTVSQNVDYAKYFRAHYDEAKNKIVIEADQNAIDNEQPDTRSGVSNISRIQLQNTVKAASALNQALSVMSPIIEGSGQNEAQTVQDLIGTLGQQGSQRGFLSWLGDTIRSTNMKTSRGTKPEGNYTEVPTEEPVSGDQTQIQYDIPEDVVRREGGGAVSSDYIRDGLITRGLPPHVAQGIILNLRDESGLNPDLNERSPVVAGSRGGYGLAQWTGPRRRDLEAFAEAQGRPVSDPDVQMDFLLQELNGPEADAYQRLLNSGSTSEAARAFLDHFERPTEAHRQRRAAAYSRYQDG